MMSDSYCKPMRSYFRDDENYIGWIESINRALHMENARLEFALKQAKEDAEEDALQHHADMAREEHLKCNQN